MKQIKNGRQKKKEKIERKSACDYVFRHRRRPEATDANVECTNAHSKELMRFNVQNKHEII